MPGQPPVQRIACRTFGVALIRRSANAASFCGLVTPAIMASIMRRPLTPGISLMTVSSLMLASSSVFWIRWVWYWSAHGSSCLRERSKVPRSCGISSQGIEAALDQAARQQIGDPRGVVDVGLASRDIFDVGRTLATSSSKVPSLRMFHTASSTSRSGSSIATCVQRCSVSQASKLLSTIRRGVVCPKSLAA